MAKTIARIISTGEAEPALTPRQNLETTLLARNAARAELEVLLTTTDATGEASIAVRAAEERVRAAETAIEANRRASAVAYVQQHMSQPPGAVMPSGPLHEELLAAREGLDALKSAKALLLAMVPAAEGRVGGAEWRVAEAIKTVMVTEVRPLSAAYLEEHARLQKAAAEDMEVYEWLRLQKLIDVSDVPMFRIERHSAADAWKDWAMALDVDAAAPMPVIAGLAPMPFKR
jgi:hypothetical protein